MMKLLFVTLVLSLSMLVAEGCSTLARLKVMQQWGQAFGSGVSREDFSVDVWRRIFKEAPETKAQYFTRVRGDNIYSPEFRAHAERVLGGFDMTMSLLDDPQVLEAALAHLKKQHVALSISANYFDVFRTALLDTVQSRIGRCFDQDAWLPCVKLIEDSIQA